MNALMLTLAVRFGGGRLMPVRMLLAAAAGAAIAQMAQGLSHMQAMLLWLPSAMLMMRIARGKRSRLIADALLLLCAAGLAGGMVLALWGATGSLALAYALAGIAAVCIGMCAVRKRQAIPQAAPVRILCRYRGREAVFDAMIDSGNTLRDYLTHLPVIVIPEETGKRALELDGLSLRPIFAQTAGGRQRMHVFAPERIELELDGAWHAVQAVIAFSPQMSGCVPALVPASLLGGLWNSN